jgi:hypothetical protein
VAGFDTDALREPRSNSRDLTWNHASMFDSGMDTFALNLLGIGVYKLGGPTVSGMSAYYKLSGLDIFVFLDS